MLCATLYPSSLKLSTIIDDVLPFPELPVTAIILELILNSFNKFLFNFRAISPGSELPLPINFNNFSIIFDKKIVKVLFIKFISPYLIKTLYIFIISFSIKRKKMF
ncbi:unknown [Clostridium sp. CAG:1219]|nr:unknown [Clostridium sp. CAG:1219]